MFFLFPSVPPPPYFFNNIYVRLFLYAEQFCLSTFFKHLPFSPFFPALALPSIHFSPDLFLLHWNFSSFEFLHLFLWLSSLLSSTSLALSKLFENARRRGEGVGYEVGRDLHFSLVFQKIVFPLFFFSNLFEKNMGFFLF